MPKYETLAQHISPEDGKRVFPPAEVEYSKEDGERLEKAGCLKPSTGKAKAQDAQKKSDSKQGKAEKGKTEQEQADE